MCQTLPQARQAKGLGMTSVDEDAEIEEEDDIFNRDKSINQEIDDEVTKLLGDNKMYGKDSVFDMSTLPGQKPGEDGGATATAPESAAPAKPDGPTDVVSAFMSGASVVVPQNKAAEAAARAAAISQKFGFRSTGQRPPPKPVAAGADADGCFETTIEINDFPAEARFKVTRKEFVDDISDRSETAITTRGSYYPPGSKLKETDKKLYVTSTSHRGSCHANPRGNNQVPLH